MSKQAEEPTASPVCKKIEELVSPLVYRDVLSVAGRDLPWERLDGKTVFITGANGFISYYLVLTCLIRNDRYGSGIRVVGLVRSLENARKKYGAVLEREDLTILVQDVCEAADPGHVDFIIHAASQASAWHFEHDPVGTINANLLGTQRMLELARKHGAELLMISSLKVYGSFPRERRQPMKEEDCGYLDQTSYQNCYAVGKRAAETLCASYHKQYGLSVKLVRPSYIYGPTTMHDDRVWAQFLANAIRREDIVLKSSGSPYRSFCYVTDTAAAMFTVLLRGEIMQPYNISCEEGNTTIRGLARAVTQAFPERSLHLRFANLQDEAEPDPQDSVWEILDSEKLRALGWKAEMGLTEGLRRAAEIMEESV